MVGGVVVGGVVVGGVVVGGLWFYSEDIRRRVHYPLVKVNRGLVFSIINYDIVKMMTFNQYLIVNLRHHEKIMKKNNQNGFNLGYSLRKPIINPSDCDQFKY